MRACICVPVCLAASLISVDGALDLCSTFQDGMCTGRNAHIIKHMMGKTVDECCAACMATPSCFTWSFGKHTEGCWLKGQLSYPPYPGFCITGTRPIESSSSSTYPMPIGAKNVLFIVVDDMRPSIGAYNFSLVHTPNMDKLASEGLLFTRAYAQYPSCSPSRHSFMTGRRPDTTRVWEFVNHFREAGIGASWTSLPQYFKKHGYLTLGGGKLFHPSTTRENIGMPNADYPASWSPEYTYFDGRKYKENPFECEDLIDDVAVRSDWCAAKVAKEARELSDQKIRDNCIEHLRMGQEAASKGRPFFVGCGFHRPHVPWEAPTEFFDNLHDHQDIPLAAEQFAPIGMPEMAWHFPFEVHGMERMSFNGTCNETRTRLFRRAYYAAVSYQDYNIGLVLQALQDFGLKDSSVVALFSDNGWHLGEQAIWSKSTNFELALRIPLIIRAPWKTASIGKSTNVLAELVDVYPTLATLAGLPLPQSLGEHVNGTSLEIIFDNTSIVNVKDAAFSQYGKGSTFSVQPIFQRNETQLMGYSVRVDEWRYTAWFAFDKVKIQPIVDYVIGQELYDHRGDTGLWLDFPGESTNLVHLSEYAPMVRQLHKRVLDHIQLTPHSPEDHTPLPSIEGEGTCAIFGDPHIVNFQAFDKTRYEISLTSTEIDVSSSTMNTDMDTWLVRTPLIDIKGRVRYERQRRWLKTIIVGGPFINNNTLMIGGPWKHVEWNNQEILSARALDFHNTLIIGKYENDAMLIQDPLQKAKAPGVIISLPLGTRLQVNMGKNGLGFKITMPRFAIHENHDGDCGNFGRQDRLSYL